MSLQDIIAELDNIIEQHPLDKVTSIIIRLKPEIDAYTH